MRATITAGLIVLAIAGDARAGPFGRWRSTQPAEPVFVYQPADAVLPAPVVYPATFTPAQDVPFPILAAFALASGPSWAPGAPPPLGSGEGLFPALPKAVNWTMTVFAYLGAPYSPIGIAVPRALRSAHVVLNGSPYAGRPVQTVYWVAFPLAAQVTDQVRGGGGLLRGRQRCR